MIFPPKRIVLKDGREVTLRTAEESDAGELCRYLRTVSTETDFLIRGVDDCDVPEEEERGFIRRMRESGNDLMITAFAGERIVANCEIGFHERKKTCHRAGIGIAVISGYWDCGLGTALMQELIAAARDRGISQVELAFIEGNDRARHLYEKLGFAITGEIPDAICLPDGTMRKEVFMRLCL